MVKFQSVYLKNILFSKGSLVMFPALFSFSLSLSLSFWLYILCLTQMYTS